MADQTRCNYIAYIILLLYGFIVTMVLIFKPSQSCDLSGTQVRIYIQ